MTQPEPRAETKRQRAIRLAPPEMRARLKAAHLAADGRLMGRVFTHGDIEIDVFRGPDVDEHGRLVVWVRAKRNGRPVHVDNPYLFANPPLGDSDDEVGGRAILREIIGQAVEHVANRGR